LTLPLSLSLLLALNLTHQSAAACEGGVRPAIHVVAEPASVSVAADFSLSEISGLAHRAGGSREQAPLGFYSSTVLHTVTVQLGSGPTATCAENLRVELNIELADRRIEIGREMQQQSCRYSAVLLHYKRKADADRTVFADYVNTVATALGTTPLPIMRVVMDDASAAAARHELEQWVRNVVAQNLPSLQKARRTALQAVDTADEMRQLAEACSQGT
jgi:hypothetical protein